MNDGNSLPKQIKQLFAGKKTKLTIYIIGVLWIAVIMQLIVNSYFRYEKNILEAFVSTNSEVSSFELEMAANYGTGYLSEDDRKELVQYVANNIGLQVGQDVTVNRKDKSCEIFTQKMNKNAETIIKIVSVEQENTSEKVEINHFLIVRLKIYKNLDSVLTYRTLLEDIFKNLKVTNLQTTMQLTANYKGRLSLEEKNTIADSMIKNLEGKVAYANRRDDLFTVYAYSGLLKEYVTSMDTKININVAISYDEATDTTNVYLGTPLINSGY